MRSPMSIPKRSMHVLIVPKEHMADVTGYAGRCVGLGSLFFRCAGNRKSNGLEENGFHCVINQVHRAGRLWAICICICWQAETSRGRQANGTE